MQIIRHLVVILFCVTMISCSKIVSGGFWTEFRPAEIVSKKMDHGGWGGTTEIHWKGRTPFHINEIINFAKENGWEWINPAKANLDYPNEILQYRYFGMPEIKNKTIVYFQTNLNTIKEVGDQHTTINCFAILNKEKNDLIVYHYWGDF